MKTNANNKHRNLNAVRTAAFEALESRQMMSVSWSAGALTINGSNAGDTIVVDYQDSLPGFSQIRVHENGAVTQNWTMYQNAKGLTVYGNAGNDTIDLSAVKFGAVVFGGADHDTVKGTKAADAIYGNDGNDTLYGNGGADTLDGGAGSDTLVGGAGADALLGGTGMDYASYAERTKPVYVVIDGYANDGEAGEFDNVHTDVENLVGGTGNDILTGSSANNLIQGNGGNDILHGGNGDDVLFGALTYVGAAKNNTGIDLMFGDAGDDQLWAPSAGIGLMHGGADNDIFFGSKQSDDIYGEGGDDLMYGGAGNDNLYGGVGKNRFYGGEGDDVLVAIGGSEQEEIYGDGGKDTFWTDNAGDTIDFDKDEANAGRVHRVAKFEDYKFLNGLNITPVAVGKNPLGQNLPDPIAPAGTDWANFGDKPLFGPNGPTPDEVRQGTLGDCWFLGALSNVARKNPGHLRNHVVPLGDGTFAVEFFGGAGGGADAKYVRVDGDLPVDSSGNLLYAQKGAGGSIWAAIFEKAETVIRPAVTTYQMIESGTFRNAFTDLGGRETGFMTWDSGSFTEATLLSKIDDLLTKGNLVGFGTMDAGVAKQFIVPKHAYSVVKVNKDANGKAVSITLRNPWGRDGEWEGVDFASGDPNDGYVTLTAHEAYLAVSSVGFGKF